MVSDLRQRDPYDATTGLAPREDAAPVLLEAGTDVARVLTPLFELAFGGRPPVRFEFWDGSSLGPVSGTTGNVRLRSPLALQYMLWSPDELGFGRAYVTGEIEIGGDAIELLRSLRQVRPTGLLTRGRTVGEAVRVGRQLGLPGAPPSPPAEEFRRRGRLHSRRGDARAISHHYDVGNDFYRLLLGPSMTYSCARWGGDINDLTAAQAAKHELVCRKLGLHERPGTRLLDVGCGWGSLAMHAATHYEASVVGVTISDEQVVEARERVRAADLIMQIEIRNQDYRDLEPEPFDAISSIGMFEHVGVERTMEYFTKLRSLLRPKGRILNHAISKVGGGPIASRSFMNRYVFPNGTLMDVADTIRSMEAVGFEVRDVESLREHYSRTLRSWLHNLESDWDRAVRAVGEPRARIWRAYIAASAVAFEEGDIAVHQVLGVVPDGGRSAMPWRRSW